MPKKILIGLMLGSLTISAFFMRAHNFKASEFKTIDEIVYFYLGLQLTQDITLYNSIAYGKQLAAEGRDLPAYFFQPLYKHPPLFAFCIAAFIKMFGPMLLSAGYIPIFLGSLMIPLVYWLGKWTANERVGLWAACFLWLDPVSILCSQKVWLETPTAFFVLLAGLFFVGALVKKQDNFFLLSGIASGLATNTKYTGFIITLAVILFTCFYRRDLFRNMKFLASLFLPLLMLGPWFYWNFKVYGSNVLAEQAVQHADILVTLKLLLGKINYVALGSFLGVLVIAFIYFRLRKKKEPATEDVPDDASSPNVVPLRIFSFVFVGLFFLLFMPRELLNSLQIGYIPRNSWQLGFFLYEDPSFYLRQLLEFSPFYILCFTYLLLYQTEHKDAESFVRISGFLILLFFMFWGNYQSRYVVSVIPFLLVLGSILIDKMFITIQGTQWVVLRSVLRGSLLIFLVYIVVRTMYINVFLSYTNNTCYF